MARKKGIEPPRVPASFRVRADLFDRIETLSRDDYDDRSRSQTGEKLLDIGVMVHAASGMELAPLRNLLRSLPDLPQRVAVLLRDSAKHLERARLGHQQSETRRKSHA